MEFEICPICLDSFSTGITTITKICNHKFHLSCLQKCGKSCPLCRTPLASANTFLTMDQVLYFYSEIPQISSLNVLTPRRDNQQVTLIWTNKFSLEWPDQVYVYSYSHNDDFDDGSLILICKSFKTHVKFYKLFYNGNWDYSFFSQLDYINVEDSMYLIDSFQVTFPMEIATHYQAILIAIEYCHDTDFINKKHMFIKKYEYNVDF